MPVKFSSIVFYYNFIYVPFVLCRTHGDVLRNLGGDSRSPIERLVKVGYGMSLLASVPLLIIPLQSTFSNLVSTIFRAFFGGKDLSKDLKDGVITAAVLASACTIAILVPNVEYVFGLAGSTASVLISFVIPAALFLQVSGAQRGQQGYSIDITRGSQKWVNRRRAAAVLLAFGLIAGISCTVALVGSIQEEAEVVQLAQEIAKVEKKAAEAVATREEAVTVAQAADVVGEARRRLNATREGVDEALTAVEKASKTADESGGTRFHKQKQAARDLKPALKAAEEVVAQLESAATALEAVLASTIGGAVDGNLINNVSGGGGSISGDSNQVVAAGSGSGKDGSGGGSSTGKRFSIKSSSKFEALRKAGLETLQAARESQIALKEAQETLKSKEKNGEHIEVEEVMQKAFLAATAAAKKLDQSMVALRATEAQQKSEMAQLVSKLGKQQEESVARAAATAAHKCADGKHPCPPPGKTKSTDDDDEKDDDEAPGGGGSGSDTGASGGSHKIDVIAITQDASDLGDSSSNTEDLGKTIGTSKEHIENSVGITAAREESMGSLSSTNDQNTMNNGSAEEEEEDDDEEFFFDEPDNATEMHVTAELKQDIEAGREVNATQVIHVAAEVAEDVVQSAKAAAEQAVGKAKKVDVAVRAIEIANELNEASTKGQQKRATSSSSSKTFNAEVAVALEKGEASVFEKRDDLGRVELGEKGPPLLGNLTAVAEAVGANKAAEKSEEVGLGIGKGSGVREGAASGESSQARMKNSRKLDPSGG